MSLKLIAGPTSEPVSLDTVKRHLSEWDDDQDSYIAGLLAAARQWCEVYTRRSFVTTTWRQTFAGLPRDGVLCLARPPVQSVTSFEYTDGAGEVQAVPAGLYEIDTDSEPARLVRGYNQTWPTVRTAGEATPVTVVYVAGWASASAVPEAIQHAILLVVRRLYDNREGLVPDSGHDAAKALLSAYRWGDYP